MRRSEARPSVALLSSQVWTLTESRHKQGAVKHFDSFRKRPIHSNQGKQLQRRKFTSLPLSLSLLRFAGKKKEGKSLGLRRCVTVCQHVNRVLSLLFSVLLFFSSYVVTDRRQAAQQHGWFFWGFLSFFFLSCGVRGKRGMGLEGEGERLCGVPKRSRGYTLVVWCYKYSRSRAWWRAMRSEWLEILQKGMLCCGWKRKHLFSFIKHKTQNSQTN